MAAATADRLMVIRGQDKAIKLQKLGKASTTYYYGTLKSVDASGDVLETTDAASEQILGIGGNSLVAGSSPVSPDDDVIVLRNVIVRLVNDTNLTIDDEGKNVYALDNQTVTNAATATNNLMVGTMTRFISTTEVEVLVGEFANVNA